MKSRTRSKPEIVRVGNIAVKIYKRERPTANGNFRTVFEVADYTTGTRRLRGFTDHTEARREAERIARQLSTGQATAAGMRGSDAASYGRALELLRPTGAHLENAAAAYTKAYQILGGDMLIEAATFYSKHRPDRLTQRTVTEVVSELLETKAARGKSARYIGDLRARLTKFADVFKVNIASVTTADVQRFIDGLQVAPQTAKNSRTVLRTLFAFAEARGYALKGSNPAADTEKISAQGGAIEIFSPAEVSALLKAASPDFLPFVALGAFAGLRSAEIMRLTWQDVDLDGGFVHLEAGKAKTKSRRLVPIVPCLVAWLAPYAGRSGLVWAGGTNGLQAARAECVKDSGVPWKANALRHSFISYRLADIQNAAQVALEAGNSPAVVFKHYRELVKPADAKAWFSVMPEAPANVVAIAS